ncbi:creatininase family protein [Bradyrhizobium prioriisuperbiae]|uniref:creatininase family protein n=1 Tax=Bradyrhizobium prioriisuperbiae TaxID=2854389 RepID=UPI0028E7909F|nr:creatininase family protein [Bradyrhizobium prioritasuperba]
MSTVNAIARMIWDQVAQRIDSGAAAILPVGAGAKEHGFHLPMNTDQIQAEWLSDRLADRFGAIIWPTVSYGAYPAFAAYAGSSSLTETTFEAVIREIAGGILGFGCRKLLVVDTGISTIAPIARALSGFDRGAVLHLRIHDGPRYRHQAQALAEQPYGSHADELETSIMLALAPDVVDMPRAEASPWSSRASTGALTPSDPASDNYSRSGSFGDPTLATAAKGNMLLAAMLDDLAEAAAIFIAAAIEQQVLPFTAGRVVQ